MCLLAAKARGVGRRQPLKLVQGGGGGNSWGDVLGFGVGV